LEKNKVLIKCNNTIQNLKRVDGMGVM